MSDTPNPTPAHPASQAPAAPASPGQATSAAGTRPALSAVDIIAFVCEIFAFGTLALWGFTMWPFPWNIVAGIAAPVAAILAWALFVSPRAVFAVHPFVRAIVELLVYASATVAWWMMGNAWIGLAFGVVAVTAGLIAGRRRLS
ncbi:YrdB family protein [Microbacterium sp. M3]|uniref:YrdB family protein n=1 Tax=Microbacterium arthrosphaerae TaxID=792652 RepID=A0ABU4H2C4_9MICO|nr:MULTISPECIES: YrdB family protein [Microbacterium]MDW4573483.1 YrdB family protein [Microbacterium arthrosphaerae]MDW7607338.1 YrdB family protein [Microbacterium sp. M3]